MGLFDDIPNVGGAPAGGAPGGMFDDLPDDPLGKVDFASVGDDTNKAKALIDALPKELRGRAKQRWADSVVKRGYEGAGIMTKVDDYVRRFAGAVPVAGAYADEANAYLESLFGSDYEMAHAVQEARDRHIKGEKTTKLGTLPLVGDVTTGGVAEGAGLVSGAVAMPFLRLFGGAGVGATTGNVVANAGLYGGLDAAGRAQDGERIEKGVQGAVQSATIAAPLGYGLGKLASRGAPRAATEADNIAAAADDVGVALPRIAAGGDGIVARGTREAAAGLGSIPFVGTPITKAAGKAIDDMGAAAERIAGGYADDVTPKTAGDAVKETLVGWIKGDSTRVAERLYDDVAKVIPESSYRPLKATGEVVKKLQAEDLASASSVNAPAIEKVMAAIENPAGLTFSGLLRLRTNVGALIDDHLLPAAGTTRPALKRLYEGLSKDLEATALQFGGSKGVSAWQKATKVSDMIASRREALTKIVGMDGMKSSEGLIDGLVRMASTKSSADIGKLMQARKAMGGSWDEVASAAVGRLGRNQSNEFSPAIFLKNYSGLSESGKQLLFNSTGKTRLARELNSLATVAEKFKNLDRLRNTSGTGRVNSVLGVGAGVGISAAGLFPILKAAIPGHILARMMAKPVRVRQIGTFAESLHNVMSGQASGPALKMAMAQLAIGIADENDEDPREVERRLMQAVGGQ